MPTPLSPLCPVAVTRTWLDLLAQAIRQTPTFSTRSASRLCQVKWGLAGSATLLLMTGCEPSNEIKTNDNKKNEPATALSSAKTTPTPPPLTPISKNTATDYANQAASQLELSYARQAANVNNQCPKLVDFQPANPVITRKDEQLVKGSCDYYVYLNEGDSLQIRVSNDLQAQLVSPEIFDFKQGTYLAPRFDKYNVQIRYDGTRFQPTNLKYNIVLIRNSKVVQP